MPITACTVARAVVGYKPTAKLMESSDPPRLRDCLTDCHETVEEVFRLSKRIVLWQSVKRFRRRCGSLLSISLAIKVTINRAKRPSVRTSDRSGTRRLQ